METPGRNALLSHLERTFGRYTGVRTSPTRAHFWMREHMLLGILTGVALAVVIAVSVIWLAGEESKLSELPICHGGATEPFRLNQIVKTFTRVGIRFQVEKRDPACENKPVANVASTNIASYYAQGDVVCTLSKDPTESNRVSEFLIRSIGVYYFDLENVECALTLVGNKTSKERQLADVRATMHRLEGSLSP